MKLYKIKICLAAVVVMLMADSCKKSYFTDVNNNPNAVNQVDPNLLLPSCEIALAFTQGGDFSRYSSLLTQQAYGAQNQTSTFYLYGINAGTFENGWGDMYTSTMENIYTLRLISDEKGYNAYAGIAKILMAYCLQLVVDDWGNVPYTEALKGNLNGGSIHPKYDDGAALYDSAANLVDAAITQLSGDPGLKVPGSDDAIYGGDLSQWIKFGHAIKARLYIHQSKGSADMANKALTEIASSFTSNADNAQYVFAGSGTTSNPWEQFMNDRAGYITFTAANDTLIHIMTAMNDPRLPKYATPGGLLGPYYGSANSPVEFITLDELLFMKAEATLRAGGTVAAAQGFYVAAIDSNMNKLGVAPAAITTYLAANGTLPLATDAAIGQVATQEYIALFLNPEAWTLYRRTGAPAIRALSSKGVPRRLIYPQSEYSYNAANVPPSTLYTPAVFWDK